jgi:hypothetical protein
VPGIGLNCASQCAQRSFFTAPFSPTNAVVATAKSRTAPSSWLDEVRSFSASWRHVSALFSCSGGFGMISKLVEDTAPPTAAGRRPSAGTWLTQLHQHNPVGYSGAPAGRNMI